MSEYSFDGYEYDVEYSDYSDSFFYGLESDGAFIEYETEGYEDSEHEDSEDRGEFEGHYASIDNEDFEGFENEAFEEDEKEFLRTKKRKVNADAQRDLDEEEKDYEENEEESEEGGTNE